jgi:hypothetical protein
MALQPLVGLGFVFEVPRSHSDTPHSVGLHWLRDLPSQRPLPDNTQHLQQADNHATGGIPTRNPDKRTDAERVATGVGLHNDYMIGIRRRAIVICLQRCFVSVLAY